MYQKNSCFDTNLQSIKSARMHAVLNSSGFHAWRNSMNLYEWLTSDKESDISPHRRHTQRWCNVTPYTESLNWLPWQWLDPRSWLYRHWIASLQKLTQKSNSVSLAIIQAKFCSPSKAKKWLPWQGPLGAVYRKYLHSVSRPLNPLP